MSLFVTFEGGEGVGKSTQIKLAEQALRIAGWDVVTTREPGGTPQAEALRDVLMQGLMKPHGPLVEAMLMSAARRHHVDHLIRPALQRGTIVLCDRFYDSTYAYQGISSGVDERSLGLLTDLACGDCLPHLTILLDAPIDVGLTRASRRSGAKDRFEAEDKVFHEKVRQGFLARARQHPKRIEVIDATEPTDKIAARIYAKILTRLPSKEAS